MTPDRDGRVEEITLGFDAPDAYRDNPAYFGAVVGRCANRIGKARFTLDGVEYRLAANEGENALHGGSVGFDQALWRSSSIASAEGPGVALTHHSPHGDNGFPGDLDVRVTYTLAEDDRLLVDYEASATRATPVNLSQHAYWELAGSRGAGILGHEVQIFADRFTPVDAALLPTGELRSVAGTPFDLRSPARIGDRLGVADEQLALGHGFDHNFVIARQGTGLVRAARLTEPVSGRTLEVWTTEPGLQFYTGNFLDGTIAGRGGVRYMPRAGLCLETQHFPDSPNRPNFPSTIVPPGETWRSRTVFAFGRDG